MKMTQLQLDEVRLPNDHQPAPGSIEAILPHGAENAISARDLTRISGCRDTRELRHRVAAERSRGALILSLPTVGYFLPDAGRKGQMEMRAFVGSMRSRAFRTLGATTAAQKFLDEGGLYDVEG